MATAGQSLGEHKWTSIVIQSLSSSEWYNWANSIIASAELTSGEPITADKLITAIGRQYDLTSWKRTSRQSQQIQNNKGDSKDQAYAANSNETFRGKCYNCQGFGHRSSDCPSP